MVKGGVHTVVKMGVRPSPLIVEMGGTVPPGSENGGSHGSENGGTPGSDDGGYPPVVKTGVLHPGSETGVPLLSNN